MDKQNAKTVVWPVFPRESQVIESSCGALLVAVSCGGKLIPEGACTMLFQPRTGSKLYLSEGVIPLRDDVSL